VDILFGQQLIASIGSMRNFSSEENLDLGGFCLMISATSQKRTDFTNNSGEPG
jgi:hypothetical protein